MIRDKLQGRWDRLKSWWGRGPEERKGPDLAHLRRFRGLLFPDTPRSELPGRLRALRRRRVKNKVARASRRRNRR